MRTSYKAGDRIVSIGEAGAAIVLVRKSVNPIIDQGVSSLSATRGRM